MAKMNKTQKKAIKAYFSMFDLNETLELLDDGFEALLETEPANSAEKFMLLRELKAMLTFLNSNCVKLGAG